MKTHRITALAGLFALLCVPVLAGPILGTFVTPLLGPVANGRLLLALSQQANYPGSYFVVPASVSCATSTDGSVVGVPNPQAVPVGGAFAGLGTLPAGVYFVEIAYTGASSTDTLVSPEVQFSLTSAGQLQINAPALQPAAATGYPAQPSVVQCSQPDDAGNYFGDTGFFQVAENNGQRVTAVFEYRNQIYTAKQDGLHLVTPNDGDPATWGIEQILPHTGICGCRAVAVGEGVVIFVHRTGAYLFDGGMPQLISEELLGAAPDHPGLWERINWEHEALIWVAIDQEQKCVRIGVPLDGAATCSHILKLDYLGGWNRSMSLSPFTNRYHYTNGRRWSVDTIAANQAVRIKRPIPVASLAADRRLGLSQVLLSSSGADGRVLYIDPDSALDDGRPIPWRIQTGAVSAAELLRQQRQGLEMIGIVQMRARGHGAVTAEYVVPGHDPVGFATWNLQDSFSRDQSGLALAQGEAVGLRLSNQHGPAAIRLMGLYVFARPSWLLRAGV